MGQILPKIAIVGRPNVGKSALFNAIVKKQTSIVDDTEGVTRDRLYGVAELFGKPFEVIDTGGLFSDDPDFRESVMRQAQIAVEEADAIILVVDGTVGPQAIDQKVARMLHLSKKPLYLAVNKIDSSDREYLVHAFSCLGIKSVVGISALHRYQIAELLEGATSTFAHVESEEVSQPKVAIIGRPNVGKSMLLNALLGQERSIVSHIAGTTRDSIDTLITFEDTTFTLIDTAGIRRKHKERSCLEKFSAIRTERAIERADICLLVVDCMSGVTAEEKKIARSIEDAGKGCILLLNKWDLVSHIRMEHAMRGLEEEVPFLVHAPKVFISAKTGRNIRTIFPLIKEVLASSQKRIPTHQLNKALLQWMAKNHPPYIGGRRLRIYFMSQVDINPPRFILFVNSPLLLDDTYKRYLVNNIRSTFNFSGVPFSLHLKGKATSRRRPPQTPKRGVDQDLSSVAAFVEENEEGEDPPPL